MHKSDLEKLILRKGGVVPTDKAFETKPFSFNFDQVRLLRLRILLVPTCYFLFEEAIVIDMIDNVLFV